ncbi:hypothetical protein N7516_003890 [Penicillium verrucosum]|uniref:uncharacterized protein n=1 Tax=Penicillium verrucosum TaxID=60171 RepID=UPI0025455EE9|nr:uncharacterized protein N7516_003890 [Penicillium verrucosum]KAJ5943722.1 hypothetical protein N7516_003890 [Penicillium verrucosum]
MAGLSAGTAKRRCLIFCSIQTKHATSSSVGQYFCCADFTIRLDAERSLSYAAMAMKNYYDKAHQRKWFSPGDYVYLRLGHGYDIQANQNLPRKLAQRFAGKFKVIERVGRLAYRLELPPTWTIHPVISVEHLEPDPPGEDLWERTPEPAQLPPIGPQAVESILDKRQRPVGRPRADGIRAMTTEYKVRYRGRGAASDIWIPSTEEGYGDLFIQYDQHNAGPN